MQLYFIRHAQSKNNVLWEETGSSEGRDFDPALSETGRQQLAYLAQFIARPYQPTGRYGQDTMNVGGVGITHLYTSLMDRAIATGMALAEATGLPLRAWEDLHEAGGLYLTDESGNPVGQPGRNRLEFEQAYPGLVLPDSLQEEGWWNRPHEDEDLPPMRARRCLQELIQRHGGTEDRVALVSHGAFYGYLMTAILGLQGKNGYWFALNNAAVTRVDFLAGGTAFVYQNRNDFMPPELLT